jgi:hypothetical protein
MEFPDGKRFAFSILDDTDDSTVSNIAPVYALLRDIGMRTTKTVWPVGCPEGSRLFFAGETLENQSHLRLAHELAEAGFEIASHGATMESSVRERTLRGLELLNLEFGDYPRLFCNHGFNRENLYWGNKRFQSFLLRSLARFAPGNRSVTYHGDDERSPYFWGDQCLAHIQYVRNFTFRQLNMLDVNPEMPYRLRSTPYVNFWFSTSDAPNVGAFNRLLQYERIDELEEQGGVCIVSTHLGKGFVQDRRLNQTTEAILRYITKKPGWFVPVSDLLDYLRLVQGRGNELSGLDCLKLELRYLADQLLSQA